MPESDTPEVDLSRRGLVAGAVAALVTPAAQGEAVAQPSAPPPLPARELPARALPVPDTVSRQLQVHIGAPYPPGWDHVPSTAEEWKRLAALSAMAAAPDIAAIRERMGVVVEPGTVAGVPVFHVSPRTVPDENRDRLLVHLHGGGYVLFPGLAGAGEAMLMAAHGGFRCVSVDYRMAPDHPFPAALDDALAVWKALSAGNDPRRMGMFGTSAGGGLTLATLMRARDEGLPLPAAMAPGTPWSDLTGQGDAVNANAFVDNVLVTDRGWAGAAARLYAGGRRLDDPLVSPLFGDFRGLPPAILTSGTRDLFLSDTVRTHRRLRQAGVEAALQVFEGQSHAQYLTPFVPETEEALVEIATFLKQRLAR